MKTLIRITTITLLLLLLSYIGGSLMEANLDITKWSRELRVNLFGCTLCIVLFVNCIIIGELYTKSKGDEKVA